MKALRIASIGLRARNAKALSEAATGGGHVIVDGLEEANLVVAYLPTLEEVRGWKAQGKMVVGIFDTVISREMNEALDYASFGSSEEIMPDILLYISSGKDADYLPYSEILSRYYS